MIFDEMNPRAGYHLLICFDNTFLICCGENMSERFSKKKLKRYLSIFVPDRKVLL